MADRRKKDPNQLELGVKDGPDQVAATTGVKPAGNIGRALGNGNGNGNGKEKARNRKSRLPPDTRQVGQEIQRCRAYVATQDLPEIRQSAFLTPR